MDRKRGVGTKSKSRPSILQATSDRLESAGRDPQQKLPGTTLSKNPFAPNSGWVVQPYWFGCDGVTKPKKKNKVRFALVSMDLDVEPAVLYESHAKDEFAVDQEATIRRLSRPAATRGKAYQEAYFDAVRYSLEELKADIVCFNELAYPHHNGAPTQGVMSDLADLAASHGSVIVGGTMHDHRTYMNTGFVFHPGLEDRGVPFHKQVSAIAMKERINIPPERRIVYTRAFGLNIAIMICLDIADFSTVAAAVRANHKTDVILVCCYTEKFEPLEDMARVATYAISGYAFLVNYQRKGQKNCLVVRRGETLNAPRKTKRPSGALIYRFDCDSEELRTEKELRQYSPEKVDHGGEDHDWLFGDLTLPVKSARRRGKSKN